MAIDSPAAPWRPVKALASSSDSLCLRQNVAQLTGSIYAKLSPSELEKRAIVPTFVVERDEWCAYKQEKWKTATTDARAVVRMPAQIVKRQSGEVEGIDDGLRYFVRVRYGRDGQFERRYVEQVDGVLFCYADKPTTADDQRAWACGSMELLSVVLLKPLRLDVKKLCGPYGVELVTRHQTWEIVYDTELQHRRSLQTLSGYIEPSHFAPKLRLVLQKVDLTTEVSVVIQPATTVGEVVAQALENFKQTAEQERFPKQYVASEYVLKVPGRREFMVDHARPLHEHLHANEFWHRIDRWGTETRVRLNLVHESELFEAVVESESLHAQASETLPADVPEPTPGSSQASGQVENDNVVVAPRAADLSTTSRPQVGMKEGTTDARSKTSRSPNASPLGDALKTLPTAGRCDETLQTLRREILLHPLLPLSAAQKRDLWTHRELFQDLPEALPRVLLCVDWSDQVQVVEALRLLPTWTEPSHPAAWIDLLRPEFTHQTVRAFAVGKIDEMPDATFALVLPQLVRALKFEPSYSAPLALLLIKRALLSPMQIGFELFWLLKVETHDVQYRDGYEAVLNAYIDACSPTMRRVYETQDELFSDTGVFHRVWEAVNATGRVALEAKNRVLVEELSTLKDTLPRVFQLPIDPRLEVGGLFIEKCRVLDQPNCPLLLVFKNADKSGGEPVSIIFDAGDHLHHERFSSQLVRFMDTIWRHDGLSCLVQPARCVATSSRSIVVEAARQAISITEAHQRHGIMTLGADEGIDRAPHVISWLNVNSADRGSLYSIPERFYRSNAGWAAAAAALSIDNRDEHNSMVTTDGRFFYSRLQTTLVTSSSDPGQDKRRQLPFAVAEEIHQALGRDFERFVDLTEAAFNSIRRNMHVVVTLLLLTLGAGQRATETVRRFVATLRPELTDTEARDVVATAMYSSVNLNFDRAERDAARVDRREMHNMDSTRTRSTQDDADGFLAAFDERGVWNTEALKGSRVNSSDLKVLELLSSGGYGEFAVGSLDVKGSPRPVGIKRLAIGDQTKANALTVASETERMTKLHHPNLVAFVGVEWTKEWGAQVLTEFMPHGDLRTVLDAEQQKQDSAWLAWTEWKCQLAIDVVDALVYLEDNSSYWSMQTLKARNVLLETEIDSDEGYVGGAKLSLYAAVRSRSTQEVHESSFPWLAPEQATNSRPCTSRGTIYSFGVFLTELDTLKRPYHDAVNPDGSPMSTFKVQQLVSQGVLRPTLSEDCPEAIAGVIKQCLLQYPIQRPSAKQLAYKLRAIRKNEL